MWTWGEAWQVAGYGIATVFVILTLLVFLTMLSGKIISKIEQRGKSVDVGEGGGEKRGD